MRLTLLLVIALLGGTSESATARQSVTRVVRAQFAACLVERDQARMRHWVAANGPMLMFGEMREAVSRTGCSSAQDSKIEYWTFRGSLAESLLMTDLAGAQVVAWTMAKRPTDVHVATAWVNPLGRASHLTNALSECVAQTNPQATLNLLRSQPDSTEERGAFDSLAAAIASCRKYAADFVDEVPADMLRARIALAAYQLNSEAQVAPNGRAN